MLATCVSIWFVGILDYSLGPYTVTFSPGMTSASFDIPIINDTLCEGNEDIKIKIKNSSLPSEVNVGRDQAAVIILDNDGENISC